jgi:hypothetical protein
MRLALGLMMGVVAVSAHAEHYGAALTMKDPVTLEAAVNQLDGKPAATVLVESKVGKVCEQRGCWLTLQSGSGQLHVTFKDEAFFVPSSLIGKTVLAEGRLEKATLTLEQTRQAVKERGGDPGKVTQPATHYELVARGIEVRS